MGMPCDPGDETYTAGAGETAMPTNGGNYGTTPAPEGSGMTPSPQGETTFTAGPAPSVPPQLAGHMGSDSAPAQMPTPDN